MFMTVSTSKMFVYDIHFKVMIMNHKLKNKTSYCDTHYWMWSSSTQRAVSRSYFHL